MPSFAELYRQELTKRKANIEKHADLLVVGLTKALTLTEHSCAPIDKLKVSIEVPEAIIKAMNNLEREYWYKKLGFEPINIGQDELRTEDGIFVTFAIIKKPNKTTGELSTHAELTVMVPTIKSIL